MKVYKLKFESLEKALKTLELVKDLWYSLPVDIPHPTAFLYDIILIEESEILQPFQVFPTHIKHNFSNN